MSAATPLLSNTATRFGLTAVDLSALDPSNELTLRERFSLVRNGAVPRGQLFGGGFGLPSSLADARERAVKNANTFFYNCMLMYPSAGYRRTYPCRSWCRTFTD
jgi:hypothetical protein